MLQMKSVLIRINQYSPQASGAERGALEYIKNHPDDISQMSVKELASVSYSSTSTIVRMCRKLGFEGYRDLQKSLLYEMAVRKESKAKNESQVERSGGLLQNIEKITYRNIASLEDSLKILEEKSLEKAVELIEKSETVMLFGMGASQLVAQDACLKFMRIAKPCVCFADAHSQLVLARNAKPSDVAIIISYSGCTEEMIKCAAELRAQGTPIVAITRFDHSPLVQLSTCCLYVVATEDLFRSGAMSSRVSQLNVIDILYTAFFERDYEKNLAQLEHSQIRKTGLD